MEQLLLIAWRQAESDACRAEHAAAIAGSRASILQFEAMRLRKEADRQFAELLAPAGVPEAARPKKAPRLKAGATNAAA